MQEVAVQSSDEMDDTDVPDRTDASVDAPDRPDICETAGKREGGD